MPGQSGSRGQMNTRTRLGQRGPPDEPRSAPSEVRSLGEVTLGRDEGEDRASQPALGRWASGGATGSPPTCLTSPKP